MNLLQTIRLQTYSLHLIVYKNYFDYEGNFRYTRKPSSFFMELIEGLKYIKILKEIRDSDKESMLQDLAEAFDNVKQHEAGAKNLKSAKDLLDEL